MKRLFITLLATAVICTTLLPVTFAADTGISVNISDAEATRIEVDQFYGVAAAAGWSNSTTAHEKASGGSYTLFWAPNGNMTDYFERSFTVVAPSAGEYIVDFVAAPQSMGNGKGKVEVLVNGTEIIDTTDNSPVSDPTPDEDVPNYNAYIVDMKLYSAEVELTEGNNTVTFVLTGEPNYHKPAFAADYIEFRPPEVLEISDSEATRIELDQFYNVGGASNWTHSTNVDERASGGAYTLFCNGNGAGVNTDYAEVSFDVYAAIAEDYTIDFVAGPNVHSGWNSRVELFVNGVEIFDTVDTAYASDPTPNEDFPSGTNTANISYNFDMKLYQATVNMAEGKNTVTIKVAGANYNKLCFAVDYLEFKPAFDYAAKLTLDGLTTERPNEVIATAKIVNNKSDSSNVNAVMIVAMFDTNGGIVKWEQAPVQCANSNSVTVTLEINTTVTDETLPAVASARAYLRDCGEETLPTVFNAKMTLLAPECEVVAQGE